MTATAPSPDKTERLRRIFASVAGDDAGTFVERQQAGRGTVPDEAEIDAQVARTVRGMRERYPLATDLDDDALVRVVRGFYADRDDGAIAAALGVDRETVVEARIDLHLLRDDDATAPADPETLRERFAAGVDDATVARELGVDEAAVRRYRRVTEAAREAVRVNHRYGIEFESALALSDLDEALRATLAGDRRVFDAVKY